MVVINHQQTPEGRDVAAFYVYSQTSASNQMCSCANKVILDEFVDVIYHRVIL